MLKEIILNQGLLLKGKEEFLFNLVFTCRSDGSPQISGAAHEVLLALIDMNETSTTLEILFTILLEWNLQDCTSPAFLLRETKQKHPFKPYPLSSCLFAIGKTVSHCNGKLDATWLDDELIPWIQKVFRQS